MSKIGTIVGLISLGRAFTGTPLYKRFLSGVAVVICMTIVTGMVAGAVLIGIFYGVYEGFMAYGLESTPSLVATFVLGVMTLGLLIAATISYLRGLLDIPKLLLDYDRPLIGKTTGIVHAFIDGITGNPLQRSRWL